MIPSPNPQTPGGSNETNEALLKVLRADPDNWRTSDWGTQYYVGPTMQNDGSIDWSGSDGWPE